MPSWGSFTVTNPRATAIEADSLVRGVAEEVMADARSHTPTRTGRGRAGWSVTKKGDSQYLVGNTVFYMRFLEFGTSHQPPHPVLAPAKLRGQMKYGGGR